MAIYAGTLNNDPLSGGSLDDTYSYRLGYGMDSVNDTGGMDTLLLSDPEGVFTAMDIFRSGTSLVFDFYAQGRITLNNQFAASLTASTLPATRIERMMTNDGWGPFLIQNGLTGGSGDDLIVGTNNPDSVVGGLGNDLIYGAAGNDTLNGGNGNNELHGGAGNDKLSGGTDSDDLYGDAGSDTLQGGSGFDSAYYDNQGGGVVVNLSGETQAYANRLIAADRVFETSGLGTDTLQSIESVTGSSHADCFILGRSTSEISVTLGRGNDTLIGGAPEGSAFWANAGYWDDPTGVIVNLSAKALTASLAGVTYNLSRGTARDGWGDTDTFILGNENLSLNGSSHADYLRGRDDSNSDAIYEWINGGAGNDTIDGGTGLDTVGYDDDEASGAVIVNLSATAITASGYTVAAGKGRDNWGDTDTLQNVENIDGSRFNDYLLGSGGDNQLGGRDGNDSLSGGAGNDQLNGGNGNDLLIGGLGRDWLNGGAGADRFDFNEAGESSLLAWDTISDFVHGVDKIDLSTIDANPATLITSANEAFTALIASGTAFTAAGQLRFDGNMLYGSTNNDAIADFALQVLGVSTLSSADLVM